jgi:hypothetical protein
MENVIVEISMRLTTHAEVNHTVVKQFAFGIVSLV